MKEFHEFTYEFQKTAVPGGRHIKVSMNSKQVCMRQLYGSLEMNLRAGRLLEPLLVNGYQALISQTNTSAENSYIRMGDSGCCFGLPFVAVSERMKKYLLLRRILRMRMVINLR